MPSRFARIIARSFSVLNSVQATTGITPLAYTIKSSPPANRVASKNASGTVEVATTSLTKANTFPGNSFSSSCNLSRRRATAHTCTPCEARTLTISRPIPLEAPTTTACLIDVAIAQFWMIGNTLIESAITAATRKPNTLKMMWASFSRMSAGSPPSFCTKTMSK